jgi:hypothetical protein
VTPKGVEHKGLSMQPANPPSSTPGPDPGLPPVVPPTGKMMLRLFLVPGLIVAGLVGLFLIGPTLSNYLARLLGRSPADTRSAAQFLRDLDNPNPEVRWRAASDLAQVLPRKDELASDVDFGFQLADRLQKAREMSAPGERAFAERFASMGPKERGPELARIEPERNYVMFLTACLGNMIIPVGAPQLGEMARESKGMEPQALIERRCRALWALATLGENLKRFDTKLSEEARDAVEEQLKSASSSGSHKALAQKVLNHLRLRRQGKPDAMGLTPVLVSCADDPDPEVRYHAAFAMTFWMGNPAEEAQLESALVKLAHDDGRGEEEFDERLKANPNSKVLRSRTKRKGFHVQPKAAIALARRGSSRAPLSLLEVMLDEDELSRIFVVQNQKTREEKPEEALVALTISDTLKALVQLRTKRPGDSRLVKRFGPLADKLAEHSNPAIRAEAEKLQAALNPDK